MKVDPPLETDSRCAGSSQVSVKGSDDGETKDQSDFFSNMKRLLQSTSLCNILQSHSKILVLDSRVPFTTCLKSLANYHHNFAFVYDVERMDITGYIDELSITKFLRNHQEYIALSCSQFLEVVDHGPIHKLAENVTALEAFEFTRKNSSNRLFVWSSDRKAPLGYITPSCYLFYVVKNLRGRYQLLDNPLNSVHVDRNFNKISDKATLTEALNALVLDDNISLVDDKGWIVGVLTRQKVNYYALELIKKEVRGTKLTPPKQPIVYSTPVSAIVKDMDHAFYHKVQSLNYAQVEPTLPLKKAIASILISNDRALVYADEYVSPISNIHFRLLCSNFAETELM